MNTDDFHTNYAEEFGGIITTKPMPSSVQSVTRRYASNLLRDGKNANFHVAQVSRAPSVIEDHLVGYFFRVSLGYENKLKDNVVGIGATPLQALERALTKAGVTFR